LKVEQLTISKVIEFPKNAIYKNKIIQSKLDSAIKLLRSFVEDGGDFNIIIDRETALKTFEEKDSRMREYLIITSNVDIAKKLMITGKNASVYPLTGDEFD